jgi:hypothetical protein
MGYTYLGIGPLASWALGCRTRRTSSATALPTCGATLSLFLTCPTARWHPDPALLSPSRVSPPEHCSLLLRHPIYAGIAPSWSVDPPRCPSPHHSLSTSRPLPAQCPQRRPHSIACVVLPSPHPIYVQSITSTRTRSMGVVP